MLCMSDPDYEHLMHYFAMDGALRSAEQSGRVCWESQRVGTLTHA